MSTLIHGSTQQNKRNKKTAIRRTTRDSKDLDTKSQVVISCATLITKFLKKKKEEEDQKRNLFQSKTPTECQEPIRYKNNSNKKSKPLKVSL